MGAFEEFNMVGLKDYEGSLIGKHVVPNGSSNPNEPFGAGYDLDMVHRNINVRKPFSNTVHPMAVIDDFPKNGHRYLKVEDKEGNKADILAERLILSDL